MEELTLLKLSLPLWECGLKCITTRSSLRIASVTPLVGVWIEMVEKLAQSIELMVTPLVGVWIEIHVPLLASCFARSLPLWECGLK